MTTTENVATRTLIPFELLAAGILRDHDPSWTTVVIDVARILADHHTLYGASGDYPPPAGEHWIGCPCGQTVLERFPQSGSIVITKHQLSMLRQAGIKVDPALHEQLYNEHWMVRHRGGPGGSYLCSCGVDVIWPATAASYDCRHGRLLAVHKAEAIVSAVVGQTHAGATR